MALATRTAGPCDDPRRSRTSLRPATPIDRIVTQIATRSPAARDGRNADATARFLKEETKR
jgi:hypothetical protein